MIKQRGNSWQVSIQVGGERYRKSVPSKTKAIELEAYARERLEQGLPVDAGPDAGEIRTLAELQKLVYERHWRGTNNAKTARLNSMDVVRGLGASKNPAAVTMRDIDALVKNLQDRGNSVATVNRKLSALSKMLKFAAARGKWDSVPKIEFGKESQGRIRWYTYDEEDRFLAYLAEQGKSDFRELVILLFDTGARASEAGRLKWQDWKGEYLHIWESKNGKNRTIPLPSRVRGMLEERQAGVKPLPADRIFPGWLASRGEGQSVSRMSREWSNMRDALGITDPEAVLHGCRHTYASRLVQAGVPLRAVQTLMGHATITTTERYAHLAPSNLVDAVATLER